MEKVGLGRDVQVKELLFFGGFFVGWLVVWGVCWFFFNASDLYTFFFGNAAWLVRS